MPKALYGPDLAHIQATAYAGFAAGAARGLLRAFHTAGINPALKRRPLVVDLGCGAGGWLKSLTDAGYRAVGFDASPALVRIARKTAPAAKISRATVDAVVLPPCDAVTALGEVLAYFRPGSRRAPALAPVFQRIFAALSPGGLLIFDLIIAGRPMAYRRTVEGPGWKLTITVSENTRTRVLTRAVAITRRQGKVARCVRESHRQRVFTRAEVVAALRHAGFTVKTARGYGVHPMLPRRLAFFAAKPGAWNIAP